MTAKKRCTCMFFVVMSITGGLVCGEDPNAKEDDPLKYSGPARAGDSVWLINTREITKASAKDPGLEIRRFGDGRWKAAQLEALAIPDEPKTKTIVYVHGYDFTPEKAERVGWAMCHVFAENMPDDQHVRLVIWSWPATAIKFRMVRDMKDKARRTNGEAYFLAWLLSRIDADAVIGSAMGCRIVSGSLHLLAGEAATLNTVVKREARQSKLRAVLISPAIDDDWLLPDKFHGKAISQVNRMLLLNNSMDSLLVNYALISKRNSVALGVSGLETDKLGEFAERLQQEDVVTHLGKEHGVENYLRSPATSARLREFVLAAD